MRITGIKVTDLSFSRQPDTLKKNLCTPTTKFRDPLSEGMSWFGPVALSLVEVVTDEGVTGVGTIGGFTTAGSDVVRTYLEPLVLGESPLNTERLWEKMYRSTIRFGRKGSTVAAISAIDIACWDIKGKMLGQPVYNLLGGKVRDKVPAYASRLYALDDLDQLAKEACGYKAEGFKTLKQRFGFGPEDGAEGMRRNIELIKTVRDAVGPEVRIAADAYMGWDYAYAVEIERKLRPYDLAWIEEPFMPDDLESYVRFRAGSQTLVSMGEHEYSKHGFKQLIDMGVADILQPDTNRVGGITEMKKICAMAEAAHIPICPHSNEAHNFHVIITQSNCPLVEYFPNVEPDTGNELFWKVFTGEPVAENGFLTPGDAPGLGVEVNWDVIETLRYKGATG